MRVLFCDSGFSPKEVDYMYAEEFNAAKKALLSTSLISFEPLKRGDVEASISRVSACNEIEIGIYRGWMLTPTIYKLLYDALLDKNIKLINNPAEYQFCHYLPSNYEAIKKYTPKTVFKKLDGEFSMSDFEGLLNHFGEGPIVLKDYVKSQKHYWNEACFIPNASDYNHANAVIKKFLELQDDDLNEGLVFREFIELEKLTTHSQSGMPLTKEFRVFVKNRKIISIFKYWDEGDYEGVLPQIDKFTDVIHKIGSNFFTMDIAKKKAGDWIIVELGDGQVAGLPDNAEKEAFYVALND
jgi:ATP-grasp domain, R2K clade family 3